MRCRDVRFSHGVDDEGRKPEACFKTRFWPSWAVIRPDEDRLWSGTHVPTGRRWHHVLYKTRDECRWRTELFGTLLGVEGRQRLDQLGFNDQMTQADTDRYRWAQRMAREAAYNPQVVLPSWADSLVTKDEFLILADWLSDAGVASLADEIRRGVRS